MRAELTELAVRCERAEGPDRELDKEIWLAVTPKATRRKWSYEHAATGQICDVDETRDASHQLVLVAGYTASLDAALSLVPEGAGWSMGFGVVPGAGDAPQLFMAVQDGPDMRVELGYATPALALCAAALRALGMDEKG